MIDWIVLLLLACQVPAAWVLLKRLYYGRNRPAPVSALPDETRFAGQVTVIVPTLNEAHRIRPCLEGLAAQGPEVREILVVDSHSTDGTAEVVAEFAAQDPRFRVINDPPLPPGWVGRPWALHHGFLSSSPESIWGVGIDADTQPQPGLINGLLVEAEREGYDLLSLSPQFILRNPGEIWLQPALLFSLIYRSAPPGVQAESHGRVMANGQCFFYRRKMMETVGGYESAARSFSDDVTLGRNIAARGFKVGFLNGSEVLRVRMYESMAETWTEWGRSLDLKDSATPMQTWGDIGLLFGTQFLPGPVLLGALFGLWGEGPLAGWLVGLSVLLVAIRVLLNLAVLPSYDLQGARGGWLFWFSALADPFAFVRVLQSTLTRVRRWRGREYDPGASSEGKPSAP